MTDEHSRFFAGACDIASQIVARADSDIAFVPRLVGESLHLLTTHFVSFIEKALERENITYGDHPLLRPFIELHSRELTDFVLAGVGLRMQFGVQGLERLGGDPARLLRVDLWDNFSSLIADAESAFYQNGDGFRALLGKLREGSPQPIPKATNA